MSWFEDKKSAVHSSVFEVFKHLKTSNSQRLQNLTDCLRVYENAPAANFPFLPNLGFDDSDSNGPSVNICKSIVDALYNRMSSHLPRPRFSVNGGEYRHKRTAKQYDRLTFGIFNSTDAWAQGQIAFKDALQSGTGILHVFDNDGEVGIERVHASQLFVDHAECKISPPTQMWRQHIISRQVLISRYPDFEKDIKEAPVYVDEFTKNEGFIDMLEVVEAWKLPTSKKRQDGRHVVCLENTTLADEKWKKKTFPFVFYRWNNPTFGFFGSGVIEDVIDLQISINSLLSKIQDGVDNFSLPYIFMQNGSNIVPQHFKNNFANVIMYDNQPPAFAMPPAINSDVKFYLEWLINKAYEISGISYMAATSQRPQGDWSGIALRELADQQSERFQVAAENWDKMFCDLARLCVSVAKDIYESKKELKVSVRDRSFIGDVDFKDLVDLNDEQLKIQVFPTALLPSTIAGRKQTILDYHQMGFIDKDVVFDELRVPDIETEADLLNVGRDIVKQQVDRIIIDGDTVQPNPYSDIAFAQKYAQMKYLQLEEAGGVSEEVFDNLRTYITTCSTFIQQSMPPPQQPPTQQQ